MHLPALAAACSQRLATVRKGVEWLQARGQLAIVEWQGDDLTIVEGVRDHHDAQAAPDLETELRVLLSETAAYRAYVKRVDARQLIGDK